MAISSVIAKIQSARREEILVELEKFPEVNFEQYTSTGEMILLLEAKNLKTLHKICLKLEKLEGILGIYPSYVTTADEQ